MGKSKNNIDENIDNPPLEDENKKIIIYEGKSKEENNNNNKEIESSKIISTQLDTGLSPGTKLGKK